MANICRDCGRAGAVRRHGHYLPLKPQTRVHPPAIVRVIEFAAGFRGTLTGRQIGGFDRF